MDIDRYNFWENLPTILEAICEARYVAVDLEMSGIHVDKLQHMPVPTKPSLQEAYDGAREAALQYTILQFGFTCINWDPDKNSYVTKTFNIPLHPGVVVENAYSSYLYSVMKRCISISTRSLGFLEHNGFSFPDVFQKGVPYLSLEEFISKEVSGFISGKRPAEEDLFDVANLPKKSAEFRNGVKEKISAWRIQLLTKADPKPVRVYGPSGHRLNGLQKRLAVSKQSGARILWDAICGQPFVYCIDTELVVGNDPVRCRQLKTELEQYESRLRNKGPILVGHNMLMDLCFLHCNFVGSLPEPVQEFRAVTRKRLPRIVDTKYLFTRGGDEMSPDYSLAECFAAMKGQQLPVVVSSPIHSSPEPLHHQAGYDSYMTAIVFLRKSYQLAQTGERLWYIASEDLGEGEAMRPPYLSPKPVPVQVYQALLDDHDEDVMATLANKYSIMEPYRRTPAPATAPPTPEQSPERDPEPSPLADTIPEWNGRFWGKYGNRTRVGQFSLILYMPKMAGEEEEQSLSS
ncbi:ribonuclease H-like domain-containing protein [Diaporthe sp. PMI_573]|nr:ribonuclease H-like domain-containing protein [Diaporthaceae sp. PMI_573]